MVGNKKVAQRGNEEAKKGTKKEQILNYIFCSWTVQPLVMIPLLVWK